MQVTGEYRRQRANQSRAGGEEEEGGRESRGTDLVRATCAWSGSGDCVLLMMRVSLYKWSGIVSQPDSSHRRRPFSLSVGGVCPATRLGEVVVVNCVNGLPLV